MLLNSEKEPVVLEIIAVVTVVIVGTTWGNSNEVNGKLLTLVIKNMGVADVC